MNLYHTQSTKQFVEGTTPTAPPSGVVTLFASASALNVIDSGGNVTEIGGGGGGGVTVSDTSPSSPANGDLWFNSDTGSLYVWYVDADGGQWVLPDSNISTGTVDLSSQVSDILPVENGGTGASSLSSVSLSSFSSESATDGYVATADGAGSIVWEEAAVGLTNFTEGRDDTGINASTPVVSLSATGAETNIDAAITPKGTGALLTAAPDGTAAGGNKRGANAIDLQLYRSQAYQVAVGARSVAIGSSNYCLPFQGISIGYNNFNQGQHESIALGSNNTVTTGSESTIIGYSNSNVLGAYELVALGKSNVAASWGVAIGSNNVAGIVGFAIGRLCNTATYAYSSIAMGTYANADRQSQFARAAGRFSATGDVQQSGFILRNKTTNDTPTAIFLDGTSTRLTIPSGKVFSFIAQITGIKSDGTAVAKYIREGSIKNVGGTTSLVGSIITVGTDHEDNASTDVAITADDANDALQINVTGIAAETWRWVAVLQGVEVAYGT